MEKIKNNQEINRIAAFFYLINRCSYICGLPNFVKTDNNLPALIVRYNSLYVKLINYILIFFVIIENASFFTQKNLTEKQRSDLMTLGISHVIFSFYYVSLYRNQVTVREIAHDLTTSLKKVHNDMHVEKAAIKTSKIYTLLFLTFCSGAVFTYGLEALVLVLNGEGTFVTVVTAWPSVDDETVLGDTARVVFYLLWWFFVVRLMALFLVVVILTIFLSYQYQNLQSYFLSLVKIFQEDLSQSDKERKYEHALKAGILLHMDTLRCTKESQQSFNMVFSMQICINISTLVLVMIRLMTSEHTLMNLLATGVMGVAILISTGLFMWNLGDVTVEAAKVPSAIYSSGWENCTRGSSRRVRQLICFAMMQGQERISIKALGTIELSYTSYVTIVKSSYSVFSVFY